MIVVFETSRLYLREFTSSDVDIFFDLNRDSAVTVYTQDQVSDHAHAQRLLEEVILPQYTKYGHGRWAVFTKEDERFIGWCGLKFLVDNHEVDLGYRFKKAEWGKGFATESAKASLDYGFEKCGLRQVVGRSLPANLASIHVLEKCGMSFIKEEDIDGLLHRTYLKNAPFIH
jgi:RimJ/RimL family protein N-acetyltransferase